MTFLSWASLITGPISTDSSSPSPTFKFDARSTSLSRNSLCTFLWTMIRLVAVQRWPVVAKAPQSAPSTAMSRRASSMTIRAFLPPISSETRLKASAHARLTCRPTSDDPVNEISWTPVCRVSASPAVAPPPVT